MRGLAVLVLLCGCLEESLVPCGDLSCPQGYSCVTDRCVSAQQLSACAGLADGDGCTIDGTGGKCDRGACIAEICGNGVLDPGEVCDDGNRNSGDGCNGTCTSTETCGNGIVDIAAGELCDCGDAAHPSTLCAHPNSADPSAECTVDCKPRFCGDGMVNTIEACDGSVPDDVTCASYGYYRGDVACVSCQFSVQGCSGRCGDGVIDTANGEYCDQSVPSDGSCVGFGFDEGPLSCGIGCGADLSQCHPLTWERIGSVISRVNSLTVGAGRIAVAYGNGDAYVIDGATWIKAPDSYDFVAGTPTAVWAVGSNHVASWTAAAGWQSITPPWPTDTPIASIWASDSLGLFVARFDVSALDRYQGSWTTVDNGWSAGARLLHTRTNLWLTSDFANVYTFDGTTWSTIPFGYIDAAAEDDRGEIWIDSDQGVQHGFPGAWQPSPAPHGSGLAPGFGTMMVAEIDGGAGTHVDDLWVVQQPPLHVPSVPQAAEQPMLAAIGATIYAGGADGLYELARGAWHENGLDNGTITALPGGVAVQMYGGAQYGGALELDDGDNLTPIDFPMDGCDVGGITYGGSLVAACGIQQGDGGVTFSPGGGLFDGGTLVVPDFDAKVLWSNANNSATAAAGPGMFAWRDGGAWQSMIVPYNFTALAGDSIDELYAIDEVDMGLYRFDGTSWQLVLADAGQPLVVTPTRVYIRSSTGALAVTRTTGAVDPAPFPAGAYQFAGTGGEEVFVIAPSLPRGSPLWHYDGQSLWPVRLPPAVNGVITMGSVGRDLYIVEDPGSAVEPPLWWLERTSTW